MINLVSDERFAQIIYAARKRLGYTQEDVSKATGITQGTLSKIEAANNAVSAKHWFLLSDVLNIPENAIVDLGLIDRNTKVKNSPKRNSFRLKKRYYQMAFSSVKDIMPLLLYIQENFGHERLKRFYDEAGIDHTFFIDLNNSISFLFALDLIQHFFGEETTHENVYQKASKFVLHKFCHGRFYNDLSKKRDWQSLIKQYIAYSPYYENYFKYQILNMDSDKLEVQVQESKDYQNISKVTGLHLSTPYLKYKLSCLCSLPLLINKEKLQFSQGQGAIEVDGMTHYTFSIGQ